jgi:hypothetical protein
VFSERHLHHLLLLYMKYYNGARTHLSLEKDAPVSRAVDRAGHILCRPILGGLHHQYARIYFTTGTTKMARPSRSIPLWGNPLVPAVTLISQVKTRIALQCLIAALSSIVAQS